MKTFLNLFFCLLLFTVYCNKMKIIKQASTCIKSSDYNHTENDDGSCFSDCDCNGLRVCNPNIWPPVGAPGLCKGAANCDSSPTLNSPCWNNCDCIANYICVQQQSNGMSDQGECSHQN